MGYKTFINKLCDKRLTLKEARRKELSWVTLQNKILAINGEAKDKKNNTQTCFSEWNAILS